MSAALVRALLVALTLAGALWALELQHLLPSALFREQYLGLVLGLALAGVFLGVKARRGEAGGRVPWYDWLLALIGLVDFGMLSLITPPDCVASYTAAAIAQADFWRTGWTGMRLGVVAYLVPFAFAFHPALLLRGTAAEIAIAVSTAVVAVVLLGIGCAGYLFRRLGLLGRSTAIAAGLLIFGLPMGGRGLAAGTVGFLAGLGLILVEWNSRRARTAPAVMERA